MLAIGHNTILDEQHDIDSLAKLVSMTSIQMGLEDQRS